MKPSRIWIDKRGSYTYYTAEFPDHGAVVVSLMGEKEPIYFWKMNLLGERMKSVRPDDTDVLISGPSEEVIQLCIAGLRHLVSKEL